MPLRILPADISDPVIDRIVGPMTDFVTDWPNAEIDLQRAGSHTVRIRVIDLSFAEQTPRQRHDAVWSYLSVLPPTVLAKIGLVDTVTPEEVDDSPFTEEFQPSAELVAAAA